MTMHVQGAELRSALQYQVLSTGLQHGHLLVVMVAGGVHYQQEWMLPVEKQVNVESMECTNDYILYSGMKCVCMRIGLF